MPEYVTSKIGTIHILREVTAGLKRRETLCLRPVRHDWQIGRYHFGLTCSQCFGRQEIREGAAMSVWSRVWHSGQWMGWVQEAKEVADLIRPMLHEGDVATIQRDPDDRSANVQYTLGWAAPYKMEGAEMSERTPPRPPSAIIPIDPEKRS